MNWQFWIHLALAVLGTAYFLYSYLKEKKIYQLLFVIWIPLTLLTYVCKKQWQVLLLGGIQLIAIGLVGLYIGKIYMEVKNRPRYNIEKVLSNEQE